MKKRLVVGITGASGVIYGIRFLTACRQLGVETYLVISKWGMKNIIYETDYTESQVKSLGDHVYGPEELSAPIASGSFKHDGMVIAPCSMKTMGAVASGYTSNLLIRAADVTLKENRKLLLMIRETPVHAIHLENMLKLSKIGAIIFPPVPAMYMKPQSLNDIVTHTVGRALEQVGISNQLYSSWGE